ncbi:ATP-binding cassette domain-containing protein [Pontibacter qinzhouensis]|uniref:ATP-binding cassette domain-containing protein n=1 Tax=Pontibacter qinzhouensis TaxID=2603253 RepID=A0A5C8IQ42_9BACT|nr:ABC transporter ATP-binding protein [Pontibacter qinzhouensis]TXK23330.1 ATP-binding cassette domain-containing protein [Pontibacter qinzhouensis]
MADTIITVENISKLYNLGTIGTGSLRQDMQRWWNATVLKKRDPFFDLDINDTTESSKYLWALRDINFEVKQGEALGIIGSNGSGKSTLLKIISRIVRPSHGTVSGRGKVSSLLEVGTGFHQELTGRENIYISGYILGMTRNEIRSKFDEIVAFSGIEKFIDTPVKRYSSGMYVRLAFAVAAHLEPDILIVDEVLAVGDADFQKKCLGKMREVSQSDGRTVLFVSHSMQAVNNLCDKGLWLQKGRMMEMGEVSGVVNKYITQIQQNNLRQEWFSPEEGPGNDKIRIKKLELVPQLSQPDAPLDIRVPLTVRFQFWNMHDDVLISTNLLLFSYGGDCIFDAPSPAVVCQKGMVEGECVIPGNFLNDGAYYISLYVVKDTTTELYSMEECLSFELEDYRGDIKWYGKWWGAVRPKLPFKLMQNELELV